jgi:hypothetical protein
MLNIFIHFLKRKIVCICGLLLVAGSAGADIRMPVSVLDDAFERAGTPRSNLQIPEPWESGLILSGRQPALIDALVNPFYFVPLTQVFGARFRGSRGTIAPDNLLENAYEMLHISTLYHKPFTPETKSLIDALERLQTRHHRGVIEARYRAFLENQISQWPSELEEAMSILVQAVTIASLLRNEALGNLSGDEIDLLTDSIVSAATDPSFSSGRLFLTGDNQEWASTVQEMAKIHYDPLFRAADILADAVVLTRTRLQAAAQKIPVLHEDILLDFPSPIGQIIVAGTGINYHTTDAALLVDLGGNDIYSNNAGGHIDSMCCVSLLIDMSGNDVYENTKPGTAGSAILGIGMLIDYDGYDVYRTGPVSQGAAIGGIGLLYDEGGNDFYHADAFCQGAAAFGIGMSVDLAGDDTYISRSTGQGFGTTLGLGLLVNVTGNDTYVAGANPVPDGRGDTSAAVFTQGAAAGFYPASISSAVSYYGGIGFLVDGRGDDQYLGGNFSQGAARFGAMGLLLDSDGNDYYHAADFSQGAATDWSSAALIDLKGSDIYVSADTSQAAAVNHSTGILLDYDGDDEYTVAGAHGQGHARKPFSLGLFLDYKGFDQYSGGPFVRGSVVNTFEDTGHIIGIFIDHRGKDLYEGNPDRNDPGRGTNNTIWGSRFGEIGIDTPLAPELYFSDQRALSRHQHYDMSPVTDLESGVELSRLGAGDPFTSFHALSFVIEKGKDAIPVVIKAMNRGHDSFRRTMEEGLGIILLEHGADRETIRQLPAMLTNLDPKTRLWALIQLAKFNYPELAEIVAPLLQDNDASVRKTAAQLLGRLNGTSFEQEFARMAEYDAEPACRFAALNALAGISPPDHKYVFRKGLGDPHLAVHYAARDLIVTLDDPIAIGSLQLLTINPNPYVRVSSAMTLIQLGEKSGFPMLIDSLDAVPRHVSPFDSAVLLPEFLAEYSGVDHGWNREAWQQWWADNETGLSLRRTIPAREDYSEFLKTISGLTPVQTAHKLDQLRKKHPFYKGFDTRLAPYVLDSSQKAMTDNAMDLAGKLVDYLVVMNPENPETWSIQSQYLHRSNRTEDALIALEKALNKEPENAFYRRLKEIYEDFLLQADH